MPVITGTSAADTLTGGAEPDTITGGLGADSMTGGAGFDLYVIGSSDSSAASALGNKPELLDAISGWSPADRLLFSGANALAFGNFRSTSADDYDQAYTTAQDLYLSVSAEYVVVQLNTDVIVFAPRTGQAVRLVNTNRADIQSFNITTGTLGSAPSGLQEFGSSGNDLRTLADGVDSYSAGAGDDTVNGGPGNDTLAGVEGDDQLFGGADNDVINGGDGRNYLRGDDGADTINGGSGFDDINGNMGNDFILGGAGTDWAVGGKDDDTVFGEGGDDIVYGNLGNDTLGGGTGDDLVRGGQGDDVVRGDDGNDTIAGDRGSDMLSGGLGADTFISFAETGTDRVTDFNIAEGDRVRLDPGTIYTLSQVGADTVIDMGAGNQMILQNVQLASLPNGWITVG
ncbi:calcium-binding protein [Phenylobacterium sp.]|jgi:Ca2+-binding RTX toxin-like protein|uniref:calcium-binding protein n=1 Tax=Phenylobacterium sp. TaxID=1871053 RepID=UPI0037C7B107